MTTFENLTQVNKVARNKGKGVIRLVGERNIINGKYVYTLVDNITDNCVLKMVSLIENDKKVTDYIARCYDMKEVELKF
jgi:hypothetical protein